MDREAEWTLIRRCRAGDVEAFEPLVRAHERRALAVAQALLGDPDEAADAVQEAFVRAYRALRRLQDRSAFGPWFRAILRNHCRDRLRAPRHQREHWSEQALDAETWSEPVGERRLERAELSAAVREALATLSPEHREVLVLKEIEGMSYTEIAETTGAAAGTVASRLYHARAALKRALLARGLSAQEVA